MKSFHDASDHTRGSVTKRRQENKDGYVHHSNLCIFHTQTDTDTHWMEDMSRAYQGGKMCR